MFLWALHLYQWVEFWKYSSTLTWTFSLSCFGKGPHSYSGSAGTVTGTQDAARDLREKRARSQDVDVPGSSGAPENLTFKERQRLFSQGQDVSDKVKASRKLTELENELNTKWGQAKATLCLPRFPQQWVCGYKPEEEGEVIFLSDF